MPTTSYRPDLVNLATGQISREIFVNEDIYAEEQERVFARAWLHVGHESQVPNPGDYFVSGMGEESVILCRDRAGAVHVFLNSCRHRGLKVCRYDEGNTAVFTCPYHGWSFGTDGRLVGVPYWREAYHSTLDRSQWGLVEVAQLCNYKGSIWATWDKEAPSFQEYLGDFTRYLDLQLDGWDGREAQAEVLCGIEKWRVPCNWKFPAENFAGDGYHVPWSHVSAVQTGSGGDFRVKPDSAGRALSFGNGHSIMTVGPDMMADPPNPDVVAYEARIVPEMRQRLGSRLDLGKPIAGTVFPNFSILRPTSRTIRVWHPRGPDKTECWAWVFVDKAAPPEVKKALRLAGARVFGPAGTFEQDDMDNWQGCTQTGRGTVARRYPLNYEMGRGRERFDEERGGVASDYRYSESNHRGFYRHWAELMAGNGWPEMAG
jgi:phenylpropionate dioxygenase-like ring-hydroxylating dioxygenase large terminal subunit